MWQAAEYVHYETNLLPLFDAQPFSAGNKVKVGGQVHLAQELNPGEKLSLQFLADTLPYQTGSHPMNLSCDNLTFMNSPSPLPGSAQIWAPGTKPLLRSSVSFPYAICLRVTVGYPGVTLA